MVVRCQTGWHNRGNDMDQKNDAQSGIQFFYYKPGLYGIYGLPPDIRVRRMGKIGGQGNRQWKATGCRKGIFHTEYGKSRVAAAERLLAKVMP